MRLCSFLSTSRHGVFYFRYPFTNERNGARNSIKLSLKTRCPKTAKSYAIQLGAYCTSLISNGICNDMEANKLRKLIAEYFEDVQRRSIELINREGFSGDTRQSYKDAIKYLKSDINANADNAMDIYTPIDNFKQANRISNSQFQPLSETAMPLLRQGALDNFTRLIEYGDAKNQSEVDAVLAPTRAYKPALNGSEKTSLKHVINEFIKERSKLAVVSDKHIDAQRADFALLLEIVGDDIAIDQLNGELVRHVKNTLIEIPKHRNKNALTRNLSLQDAIQVEDVEKISGKTINGYLGNYRTLFKWAVGNKYLNENLFENVSVEYKRKPIAERRQAYSQEALSKVYNTLCGEQIKSESYKWATLIGIFTGARLAEICQMEIADIQEHDGIKCFSINSKANGRGNFKQLKSDAATRLIPIHQNLRELGFGDYVRSVRNKHANTSRLFPDFTYQKKTGYTKNFGRWYNETLMARLGIKSSSHIFHGLRHTMNTRLLQAGVEPSVVAMLLGHARSGVQAQYFADGYKPNQLAEALERFSVEPIR